MLWWTSRQLNADDWKVREAAAKKLGDLRDLASIDALAAALRDSNARVRQAAAVALVRIGKPAVHALVAALKGKNLDARQGAAAALAKIGNPAVTQLGSALQDRDLNVRESAASALGEIASDAAMEQLLAAVEQGDSGAKEAAAAGLVRIGPQTIPPLIARLKDKNARIRETAAAALVRIGRAAVGPLVAALKDNTVRDAAIEVLWKIDLHWAQSPAAKTAIPALVATLKGGDERLRRAAAAALGQIGDARVLEPLLEVLADADSAVQEAAATALGELGDPRALAPLVAALQQGDAKARNAIAAAFVRISHGVVRPLVESLKSKEAAIREAAAAVLVRVGYSVVEPLVDALWKIDPDWARAEGSKSTMPQFVSALKEAGSNTLKDPKEVLRKVGDTRVMKPLVTTLKEMQNGLGKAALSLGQIKGTRDLESLSQALANPDLAVRKSAADALIEIGRGPDGPLAAALSSKNQVIRRAAAHALAEQGNPCARDVLRFDLMDVSSLVMLDAAESLLKLGDGVIVQPLLKLAKQLESAPAEPQNSRAHTAKRIVRLLLRLMENHAEKLELEDVKALGGFQAREQDRFVPSARLKTGGSIDDDVPRPIPNEDEPADWLQIRELARRELSRRSAKA